MGEPVADALDVAGGGFFVAGLVLVFPFDVEGCWGGGAIVEIEGLDLVAVAGDVDEVGVDVGLGDFGADVGGGVMLAFGVGAGDDYGVGPETGFVIVPAVFRVGFDPFVCVIFDWNECAGDVDDEGHVESLAVADGGDGDVGGV